MCATGSAWQAGDTADVEAELSGRYSKGIVCFSHERKHGRQAPSGARMSYVLPVQWPQRTMFPPQFKQGACENAKVFTKQNPSGGRREPRQCRIAGQVLPARKSCNRAASGLRGPRPRAGGETLQP